jgi:hypothetical protein
MTRFLYLYYFSRFSSMTVSISRHPPFSNYRCTSPSHPIPSAAQTQSKPLPLMQKIHRDVNVKSFFFVSFQFMICSFYFSSGAAREKSGRTCVGAEAKAL